MRRAWWTVGAVLVVGGVALLVSGGDPTSGDVGWFAYTPLTDPGPSFELDGSAVFLTRGRMVGTAGLLVGLMVLAGCVGFLLGRRANGRDEPGKVAG